MAKAKPKPPPKTFHVKRKPPRRPPRLDVYHHFSEANLARILHAFHILRAQGEQIIAQLDELKAALAATNDAIDAVSTKVTEISGEVAAVDQEVKDLIALIGTNPDLSEVLTAAQSVQAKTETLKAQVQAVDDVLDAIPPKP
jgi:chromosome segregation ATPase